TGTKLFKGLSNCQMFCGLSFCGGLVALHITFWRLAQWRISEHKTVNTPQKLMRGRMFGSVKQTVSGVEQRPRGAAAQPLLLKANLTPFSRETKWPISAMFPPNLPTASSISF